MLFLAMVGVIDHCAPDPFATEMPSILSPEQRAALAARTTFGRWALP
jgi:hypothetical protein